MKPVIFSILFILATVTVSQKASSGGEPSEGETEVVSWGSLKKADGQVVGFEGKAWFCQAKTFSGKTECYFGSKPIKPGCYVLLNPGRTAWIAVDDAAAQLGADSLTPKNKKNISSVSGFGCGVPDSDAFWLLWKIE
jgi:hypothetical protein